MYRARYIVSDQFIQKPIFLPSSPQLNAHTTTVTIKARSRYSKKKKKKGEA